MGASTSSNINNRGSSGRSVSDSEFSSANNETNFSPGGRSKSADSNNNVSNNCYNASKGFSNGSLKEHKRFGVVSLKISNIVMAMNMSDRSRTQEGTVSYTITPRGSILYGSLCSSNVIQKGIYD